MSALFRARLAMRRVRRGAPVDREAVVREQAPGRSWLDVGCMWGIHGGLAFLAEEAGASRVTGLDVMGRTPEFDAEQARRGSAVRFVGGDMHDPEVLAEVGRHDVVWCYGLLYHAPHPLLTLERLRSVCGELLLLGTEVIPEVPGVPAATVFYPGLDERGRRPFRHLPGGRAIGVTEAFDRAAGYGNWFWGLTPSSVHGMLRATGFEPLWRRGTLFAARPV
jgi:hypothetical protein